MPSCAREQTHELRQAYRLLFSDENTLKEQIGDVENPFPANPLVKRLIEFLNADTEQSFLVPDYAATRSQEHSHSVADFRTSSALIEEGSGES